MSHKVGIRSSKRLVGVAAILGGMVLGAAAPAFAAAPSTSIVSQSTAQSVNLNLLNKSVAESNPPTQAINTGASLPSTVTATGSPSLSKISSVSFLSAGALSEYAQANAAANGAGSSIACAGVVQPGGNVLPNQGGTCTNTGNGNSGLSIDLSKLPGLSSTLGSLSDVTLNLDAVTAFAQDVPSTNGTIDLASGAGTVSGGTLVVTIAGVPFTIPLNISTGINSDLADSINAGLASLLGSNQPDQSVLAPLATALRNGLSSAVSICTNYQPSLPLNNCPAPAVPVTPTGAFEVTGIHIASLSNAAAYGDIAAVTVGPNALAPAVTTPPPTTTPPTTTTTPPPTTSTPPPTTSTTTPTPGRTGSTTTTVPGMVHSSTTPKPTPGSTGTTTTTTPGTIGSGTIGSGPIGSGTTTTGGGSPVLASSNTPVASITPTGSLANTGIPVGQSLLVAAALVLLGIVLLGLSCRGSASGGSLILAGAGPVESTVTDAHVSQLPLAARALVFLRIGFLVLSVGRKLAVRRTR